MPGKSPETFEKHLEEVKEPEKDSLNSIEEKSSRKRLRTRDEAPKNLVVQDKSKALIELLAYMQGLLPKIDFFLETQVPSDEKIETTSLPTFSEIESTEAISVPEMEIIKAMRAKAQEFLDQAKRLNGLADARQSSSIELPQQASKHGEIGKPILQNIEANPENVLIREKGTIGLNVPEKTKDDEDGILKLLQKNMDDEVSKMIQKIEEICQRKIHNSSFEELTEFIKLVEEYNVMNDKAYQVYQKDKNIDNLLDQLCQCEEKINKHAIEPLNLKTLHMLKDARPTSEFDIATWRHPFRALKDRIMKITNFDYSEETEGILKIKGIVIKLKNLEPLFREGLKSIEICCASVIFLEEVNIHCRGTSIAIIAPIWKVNGNNLIDISGEDGLPLFQRDGYHFDGRPGNPGGSAGNFLGICDRYIRDGELRIIANGGNGGPGEDGLNESGKSDDMMRERDQNRPISERPVNLESRPLIRSRGGRGGCGGLGGNPGDVNITNEMNNVLEILIESNPGENGENGNPGKKIDRSGEKPGRKYPTNDQQKKVPFLQSFCGCSLSDEPGPRSQSNRLARKESHKIGSVTESVQISFRANATNTDEINTENMIQPSPNNVNLNAISVRAAHSSYFNQVIEEGLQAIIGQNPFLVNN